MAMQEKMEDSLALQDDSNSGELPAAAALAVICGAMALTAWSGQKFSPTPLHPRIRRWYRMLDKPGFTPPGPVFGAAWG